MKRFAIIAAVVVICIVAGILYISSSSKEADKDATPAKVGLIMFSAKDDNSWSQTHYDALIRTQEELGIELLYKENITETEECYEAINNLIDAGCEIIICTSFGYGEYTLRAAKENPDVFFFHATGVEQSKNLETFFGRIYQMRYLSGIVAGLQTSSNEIGYVAAFPISEVNRGINAFTLGVRAVNPEAVVYVSFCNSWSSDEATRASAELLYEKHSGIDVMGMHTNSLAACEFADEHGIYIVGYNMDNQDKFPNTYLTAPVWKWENYYIPKVRECFSGRFLGKHVWAGIETGVVDLSPLTKNVKPDIAQKVESERTHLKDMDYDVFFGPIVDNEGIIRVEHSESMTDDSMLNSFDWYVRGVVIENE